MSIKNFWLVSIILYNGSSQEYKYTHDISYTDKKIISGLQKLAYRYKNNTDVNNGKMTVFGDVLLPNITHIHDLRQLEANGINIEYTNIIFTDTVNKMYNLSNSDSYNTAKQLVISSILKHTDIDVDTLYNITIRVDNVYNTNDILSIYADGSINKKTNQCSGAIAIADDTTDSEKLLDTLTGKESSYITDSIIYEGTDEIPATNNIGELLAIRRALEHAVKYDDKNVICITSDSEYSIRSIREYIYKWLAYGYKRPVRQSNGKYQIDDIKNAELIKSIVNQAFNIMNTKVLVFRWTKGHEYIDKIPVTPFNELCDITAKEAINIDTSRTIK